MGTSAEELRRDIAQTREDLGETIDAIGDRVSPGRVVERRKNKVRQAFSSAKDRVMGTAVDTRESISDSTGSAVDTLKGAPDTIRERTEGSPLVAGGIAFGVGFLLAAVAPASEPEQRVAEQLADKAEPLKAELAGAAKEVVDNVKETAKEAVEEVKTTATDGQQAVAGTVRDGVDATTSSTRDAASTIKQDVTTDGH